MNVRQTQQALLNEYPDAKGDFPEYRICCPECGDKRYRLGINVRKPTGHCFNCGERFNPKRIAALLKLDKTRVYLPNDLGDLETFLESLEDVPETAPLQAAPEIRVDAVPLEDAEWIPELKELHDLAYQYLTSRGFPPEFYSEAYQLMLPYPNSRERGRLLLPVFEEGKLVYYQARSLSGESPKYLNPTKAQTTHGKSHFVYNLEYAATFNEIIICEGIFSSWAAGGNAVAIFGKELSNHQAFKILQKNVRKATILLDPGEEDWAYKAAAKLYPKVEVRIANLEKGDPNEVTIDELVEVLARAEKFEDPLLSSIGLL